MRMRCAHARNLSTIVSHLCVLIVFLARNVFIVEIVVACRRFSRILVMNEQVEEL